ncbi:MAG TPA: ATP-binding protein [Acidimicrobiales bacterium]|nr:ATP-binding protein [Acidimicrobiales bacterium]
MHKGLWGSLVGVASAAVLGGALYPFRPHVSVSTSALVLVIPVVVGAVVGGFGAGAVSVLAGFLVYDFFFIPPYNTLSVGTAQNWTALIVYVVVMLLVARVVGRLDAARLEAERGRDTVRRVSEVSELLVGDRPVDELLRNIVNTAQSVFNVPGVSLLEEENGILVVKASAGEPLSADELSQLDPHSGRPVRVGTIGGDSSELRTIALSGSERALAILAMRGVPIAETDRALLNTFANDAALALERAELRERALRSKLLEEADRFRRGLLGAVSHDLRTPLATIKVASSTLSNRADALSLQDRTLLYRLVEIESDRLTRLVTNLLDMTRIEAGVLTLHLEAVSVTELVNDALTAMGATLSDHQVELEGLDFLPLVDVDRVLMGQVLINLLDNAARHAPAHSVILVSGARRGTNVVLSVADHGPGVPLADRQTIFDRFTQLGTGGRAGLGLTIAKTFVEAHEERLWYEEAPGGGARFVFTVPIASPARRA